MSYLDCLKRTKEIFYGTFSIDDWTLVYDSAIKFVETLLVMVTRVLLTLTFPISYPICAYLLYKMEQKRASNRIMGRK